jgi:hypothetical protein
MKLFLKEIDQESVKSKGSREAFKIREVINSLF